MVSFLMFSAYVMLAVRGTQTKGFWSIYTLLLYFSRFGISVFFLSLFVLWTDLKVRIAQKGDKSLIQR